MYMCSHLGFIPKITTVSTSKQYTSIRDIWLQCIMCIKDYTGADLQRCSCSALRRVSGCVGLSSLSRAVLHFKAVLFACIMCIKNYHLWRRLAVRWCTGAVVVSGCVGLSSLSRAGSPDRLTPRRLSSRPNTP